VAIDHAQAADLLSERLEQLRAARTSQEPATDEFARLCEHVWLLPDTIDRLVAVYRVLEPHLVSSYVYHADATDPLAAARGASAAGLFEIARKLSTVPYIVRQSFQYVLAPLSSAQAHADRSAVGPLYHFASRVSTALVVPLAGFSEPPNPSTLTSSPVRPSAPKTAGAHAQPVTVRWFTEAGYWQLRMLPSVATTRMGRKQPALEGTSGVRMHLSA
jgi:hypothetical protein